MEAYSTDLRAKVLAAYDRGMKIKAIAEAFDVSPSWARRVKQRRRQHGELTPRPRVGKHHIKINRVRLAELVSKQPDATLAELPSSLAVTCSLSALWTALRQLGLSYKKRPSTPRSRTVPTWRGRGPSGSSGVRGSTRVG